MSCTITQNENVNLCQSMYKNQTLRIKSTLRQMRQIFYHTFTMHIFPSFYNATLHICRVRKIKLVDIRRRRENKLPLCRVPETIQSVIVEQGNGIKNLNFLTFKNQNPQYFTGVNWGPR
jgi:hypothetical protein